MDKNKSTKFRNYSSKEQEKILKRFRQFFAPAKTPLCAIGYFISDDGETREGIGFKK